MTNYKSHSQKAFTLIEMLVVISLIGILAALAMVSFSSVQKQARDTARKSDLKQYQTATESYASKNNGAYPLATTAQTAATGTYCTALGIGTCPADPKNTAPYVYMYITDASVINYVLWTGLENKSGTWWVVCSNGKNGEYVSATAPSSATCPLP